MSHRQKILLLEDVENLGRIGDVVVAKAGYIRNFLIPNKMAVVADKHTLKIQERLQQERAKKAIKDKKEAEELAKKVDEITLIAEVKVDPEGHLYGSVSQADIINLFEKEGLGAVEKRHIDLKHHIKETGTHKINLKLKEGVTTSFFLKVVPEGASVEVVAEVSKAEKAQEPKVDEIKE